MTPLEVTVVAVWLAAATTDESVINPTVIAAIVAALAAGLSAWLAYRSSSKANATNDRKVDMDEFKEAQAWYKERLAEADRHIERIRAQLDRVNDQLAREQDVSNVLRNEVRALQGQVDLLERSMTRSSRNVPSRMQKAPPPLDPTVD